MGELMNTKMMRLRSAIVGTALLAGVITPIATAAPASATTSLVSIGDSSAVEGNLGQGRSISFPITLDAPTSLDVRVDWYVVLDTASATDVKDFGGGFRTATIRAGRVEAFANIVIYADTLLESDETFEVHILGATNASVDDHLGIGTLIDDDSESTATPILGAGGGSVHEGNLGMRQGKIWVTLSAPSLTPVSVVATLTGTGVGTDYKAFAKTLTFLPGQYKKVVALTIYPNVLTGGDRVITLVLSGATSGVNVMTASVDNTIVDEESSSQITSIDDPRLTAAQVLRAQALIDASTAAMAQYAGFVGQAALRSALIQRGYTSVGDSGTGFEHFLNPTFYFDGIELDATKVESVVLQRQSDGSWVLGSAMYMLNDGDTMANVPEIAGTFTTWHDHQNLCWNGLVVVGLLVNGVCTSGTFRATPPMLHVWMTPQVCGPFTGIEGTHGGSCVH
ncbi:MAG: hypothetical protein RLY23_742 [Actinomycetota bacterium]|jgi:hypothetical protein